jgi:hypothetical protein
MQGGGNSLIAPTLPFCIGVDVLKMFNFSEIRLDRIVLDPNYDYC